MSAPIGYQVTCDDAECAACHHPEDWPGFEDWEAPIPIYYGTEADSPTHCCRCRALIPHTLTADGHDYVRDRVVQGDGDPTVLSEWAGTYLENVDDERES